MTVGIGRRVLLIGVPFAYFGLTLLHPTDNPVIGDDTSLWLALHFAQLVLIGGMAWVFWTLVAGVNNTAARVARFLVLPYVIAYTALDAIAGLAAGAAVQAANELAPSDVAAAERLLANVIQPDGPGYVIYLSSSFMWLGLAVAVVLALRGRAPAPTRALIALGALVFSVGHPRPLGPIGMGLIVIGMTWLELRPGAVAEARVGMVNPASITRA